MVIRCGECGESVVVPGDGAEGGSVTCPGCGKELRLNGGGTGEASGEEAVPHKPKLGIRRPSHDQSLENPADDAILEGVRARAIEQARQERRAAMRRLTGNVFLVLALIALGYAGWRAFRYWQDSRVSIVSVPSADEADGTCPAIDSAARPVDRPEPKEVVGAKGADRGSVEAVSVEKRVVARLRRAEVSYWGRLDEAEHPGRTNGVFSLCVPFGNSAGRNYEIVSSSTGIVSIVRCDGGRLEALSQADYEELLTERGGLLAKDGVAYFITAKASKKSWTPPTRPGMSFDAFSEYFQPVLPLLKAHQMKTSHLSFEILFRLDEKSEPITVREVKPRSTVSYSTFRKAVEPLARELRERNMPSRPEQRPYRRTVSIYDGKHISKGSGGTMVPRYCPDAYGTPAYTRWRKLRDEAYRQESESQRRESEYKKAVYAWERQLKAPIRDVEYERILCAGTVTLKRK